MDVVVSSRQLLRPGGRLVVVGCYRETAADRAASLVSLVLNPLVGGLVHPRPAAGLPVHMRAPTSPPRETLEEIRAVMAKSCLVRA